MILTAHFSIIGLVILAVHFTIAALLMLIMAPDLIRYGWRGRLVVLCKCLVWEWTFLAYYALPFQGRRWRR